MCDTILNNIQQYLQNKILPVLQNNDISVRDFQRYRQSMKVVMEIFFLNDARTT